MSALLCLFSVVFVINIVRDVILETDLMVEYK